MTDNFNHHAWKLNQLQEGLRKEIESQIDGIVPIIKKIDFDDAKIARNILTETT